MTRTTRQLTAAVIAMALPLSLAAQKPARRSARAASPVSTAIVKGSTVEGITQYTLGNGLRVVLFPDASQPTATVNITYLVGSRNEGYGEKGMAHLLEHLMFKGSPGHPNVPQELTEHGASPNGTTWFDRTNYFETFAATDVNMKWALDLEADRMVHSYIAEKDLKSEFSVVRNEFESGENDPSSVLEERLMSTAYLWHNYGNSTIGDRADIEQVPIERLQAFYHKYYEPDNSVLVVAGKFDPASTLTLIQEKFGRIPRPVRTGDLKIWPTYTAEPVQDGERSVTLRRVGDVGWVMVGWHVPAGSDPDFAAVAVLAQILGDTPSGRFYKALVESKIASSENAFAYQLKEPGMLIASAQLAAPDSAAAADAAIQATVTALATDPPTAAEVDRARIAILKNIDLTLNNSQRAALSLTEWAGLGDWRMLFVYRDAVKQVKPADVARVAAAYLKRSNSTWGTFVPTKSPDRADVPWSPDVAALVANYHGDSARSVGEAFDPSPSNIDRRTTRRTLSDGFELALLPKKTRGATVSASITLRFGSLDAVRGQSAVADLAADMLARGTTSRTRQQVKDEWDRLQSQVSISGSATSANVRIESTRDNFAATLRLLGDVLHNPAFDPKEFDQLKAENLSGIEEQRSEPTALGSIAFQRAIRPYPDDDPRATLTFDGQKAAYTAATLEQVRHFYQTFYGADHGQMSIVGDFDTVATSQLVDSLFGNWKSSSVYARVPSEYQDLAGTKIVIKTPDKANALFLSGMPLPLKDDDSSYAALVMANYMLGGGFLNSRLAERIRQKDGISYGVGSGLGASPLDRAGIYQAYAIYNPQNVGRLEVAYQEEVARALKDGFSQDELDKARQGWLQQNTLVRSRDASLAGTLNNDLFVGRTMAYDSTLEARVRGLTAAGVNSAFRRFIDPAKFITVEAGDFDKKPAVPAHP
ncbi:MAG TPA: pitrilysin family protein [Gemmatimonadales bacterium]|nr:pitrilysin family protein [Gemmatimonadales bacterium]